MASHHASTPSEAAASPQPGYRHRGILARVGVRVLERARTTAKVGRRPNATPDDRDLPEPAFRPMTPGAAEALKDAIRRALPLGLALIALGAIAMVALREYQGPRYEASADVLVSTDNTQYVLAGIDPPYVDPERVIQNAVAIAGSGELYTRAAARLGNSIGTGSDLSAATSVSSSRGTDVITFATAAKDSDKAIAIANAVARAYEGFRSDLKLRDIRQAIARLSNELPETAAAQRGPLREQIDRLELLATVNASDARVIEPATYAVQTNPRPVRDAVSGAAIGLVIALLIAGAREALNTRVRSDADVESLLDAPVLASIQTLPKRTKLVTLGGRHEPRFSDAYALLAANLGRLWRDESPVALAITSAVKGEGKTTTAANLAVAFARRGARVILADFDVRKPSLAPLFRIPGTAPGVVQLVTGKAQLKDTMWEVSLNGSGPGRVVAVPVGVAQAMERKVGGKNDGSPSGAGSLRVIPSGGTVRGVALAHSPQVNQLIERLKNEADIVLLDTPPALLTVEMAELARAVDLVLVVARQGHVTRRSLQALSRQASGWKAEVVGAVVTDTPAEDDYYGH